MNLADSIFIFGLALIIFGPKKLPEIGRQIGKIMLEFRRASNEFKMQIEEELRSAEQSERQKKFAETASQRSAPALDEPALPAASVPSESSEFSSSEFSSSESSESSESLTVRPPSTGITESTESPYRPAATEDAAITSETTSETTSSIETERVMASADPAPEPIGSPMDPYPSAEHEELQEHPTNHHG